MPINKLTYKMSTAQQTFARYLTHGAENKFFWQELFAEIDKIVDRGKSKIKIYYYYGNEKLYANDIYCDLGGRIAAPCKREIVTDCLEKLGYKIKINNDSITVSWKLSSLIKNYD